MSTPEYGEPDYNLHAALFNDVTFAPTERHVLFSDRRAIADYLWESGWRREFRRSDFTDLASQGDGEAGPAHADPLRAPAPSPDGGAS